MKKVGKHDKTENKGRKKIKNKKWKGEKRKGKEKEAKKRKGKERKGREKEEIRKKRKGRERKGHWCAYNNVFGEVFRHSAKNRITHVHDFVFAEGFVFVIDVLHFSFQSRNTNKNNDITNREKVQRKQAREAAEEK